MKYALYYNKIIKTIYNFYCSPINQYLHHAHKIPSLQSINEQTLSSALQMHSFSELYCYLLSNQVVLCIGHNKSVRYNDWLVVVSYNYARFAQTEKKLHLK